MSDWHTPVLLEAVIEWLRVVPSGVYLDATVGTGGHALEIVRRLSSGRLIGLDCDAEALAVARQRLAPFGEKVMLVRARFSEIDQVVRQWQLPPLDGLLADLGVSSLQLARAERGFSFQRPGPLDMRMDQRQELTAERLVNQTSVSELTDLLRRYGEERDASRIARAIVRARPIRDTEHLATVVAGARKAKGRQKLHPATKTFLALRIAVNRELEELEQFLNRAPATLAPGGRWVVLSYHSLEDRLVKRAFRAYAAAGVLRLLTRKPVRPSAEEVRQNPRARSARLRAAERLSEKEN